MTYLIIATVIYAAMVTITVGAENARNRARFKILLQTREEVREMFAQDLLFAIVPVIGWAVVFIGTGFYAYGFSWDFSPIKRNYK